MNYLAKRAAGQQFDAGNKRNMHNGVICSINGPSTSDNYKLPTFIQYTHKTVDSKHQRFTVEMIEKGYVYLALLPYLSIDASDNSIVFEYHRTPSGGGYEYSEQTGTLTEEFQYLSNNVTICKSILLKPGDKVIIYIDWATSGARTFGFTPENTNLTFNGVDDLNSSLLCTGKFRIYGNLGSLLCRSDEYYYRNDLSAYINIGKVTFKRFFGALNISNIGLANSNELSGSYDSSNNNKLVDASELYLPKLDVESAYEQLFYYNLNLKKGPTYICVQPYKKYCAQMFEGCSKFANYDIFLDSKSSTTTGVDGNMYRMLALTSGLRAIYFADTYYNTSNPSAYEMLKQSHFLAFLWDYTNNQTQEIFNLLRSLSAPSSIVDYHGYDSQNNQLLVWIDYMLLHPVIWIDNVEATCRAQGYSSLSQYISTNLYYGKKHGRAYRYVCTVFVEDDYRSYYVWEYCGVLDVMNCDSHAPAGSAAQYIFTTEKNFVGEALYENGKASCHPVKYCVSSLDLEEGDWTICDYDCDKLVVIKSSNIVPEENAGVPQISIEKRYDSYADIYNYNHYRSSEYRLIGSLNNKWLWRLYRDSRINEYERDYCNDTSWVDNSFPLYLSTLNTVFTHTLINDNTSTNAHNIATLSPDTTLYNNSNTLCIIDYNNVNTNCYYL